MAVDETSVIDLVSVGDDNSVYLTISDHLDWKETLKHQRMLQEKINTYCKYVENGQLYDKYPETRDRRPTIRIVFFHKPEAEGELFLERVKSVLEQEGFSFYWPVYQ